MEPDYRTLLKELVEACMENGEPQDISEIRCLILDARRLFPGSAVRPYPGEDDEED